MRFSDVILFVTHALGGYRTRTGLMLLAMAIGVASVILLTSLGEGARLYVTQQFSSLGTNLLIVLPGRTETTGAAPPLLGTTHRDLTLDDAFALQRSYHIKHLAPITVGSAPVAWQQREREVIVVGTTSSYYRIRQLNMGKGQFLPDADPFRALPVCVLGHKLYKELFGAQQPLGEWVRIGVNRCRVIGVLDEAGMSIGVDMSDLIIVPVSSALALFNTHSLFRILAEIRDPDLLQQAEQNIRNIIRQRHEGDDDVTVISQDALLSTFNRILHILTLALGGIAAISLIVAGIMIMNVMLVAVSQRTTEIGLLKALGASEYQILTLFIIESAFLSLAGALIGLSVGLAANSVLQNQFPEIPFQPPFWAIGSALLVAVCCGIIFGVMPALRAARLDPVQALARR